MRIWWTRLPFGDGRWLVYSPRFGRTYLLAPDLAARGVLPTLLGLRTAAYRDRLRDPAGSVELVDGAESGAAVGRLLQLLYVFFHRHRTVASIDRAIRLAKWLARLQPSRRELGVPEVGRLVMEVERSVGISDCYPRALLTAYLCMTARLSCEVTVGILAPTANMHAWCSTGGAIPYEPDPQHWFYSPLVVFDVTQ